MIDMRRKFLATDGPIYSEVSFARFFPDKESERSFIAQAFDKLDRHLKTEAPDCHDCSYMASGQERYVSPKDMSDVVRVTARCATSTCQKQIIVRDNPYLEHLHTGSNPGYTTTYELQRKHVEKGLDVDDATLEAWKLAMQQSLNDRSSEILQNVIQTRPAAPPRKPDTPLTAPAVEW